MAARICMQLLCIKLSCITQKQAQIFDKLSFKLSFTALNPDSVGKFLGKTSGTYWSLPLRAYSTVQYSTARTMHVGAAPYKGWATGFG